MSIFVDRAVQPGRRVVWLGDDQLPHATGLVEQTHALLESLLQLCQVPGLLPGVDDWMLQQSGSGPC